MLNSPKAGCQQLDSKHILKLALLQWDVLTTRQPSCEVTVPPDPSRFKDDVGAPMWISGLDTVGLFHMTEQQLQRRNVLVVYKDRYDSRWVNKRYSLEDVYNAAKLSPNYPIDEPLDAALDRYLAKIKECGKGVMAFLPPCCKCKGCVNIAVGPTEGGTNFIISMMLRMSQS